MPTGYTAPIKDGITFTEFAMNCARAMGACVMLRDEPGGGEKIPDKFEPSSFYLNRMVEAEQQLERLKAISLEDAEAEAKKAHEDSEARRIKNLEDCIQLREKYRSMLEAVNDWEPPTKEHQGLKNFMQQQIVDSISFDCNEEFYSEPHIQLSGKQWLDNQLDAARQEIARSSKKHAEEVHRTNQRNEWISSLRKSLLEQAK